MKYKLLLSLFICAFTATGLFSDDLLNRVVAIVGDRPITSIDLAMKKRQIKREKGRKKDHRGADSQALDLLIKRELVYLVAEEESINIKDRQVEDLIRKETKGRGLKSEKALGKVIRKERGLSLDEYKENIKLQLITAQIFSLRVKIPPPKEKQIKQWYKKNKKAIGYKYRIRIIRKRYRKGDGADELRVSKIMNQAKVAARENFSKAARKYSDHPSKTRGGNLGWIRLDELVQKVDPFVANQVYTMKKRGLSRVFVGEKGYYIIKIEKITAISLEDIRDRIEMIIMTENRQDAFEKWAIEERKNVAVKILLNNYREP